MRLSSLILAVLIALPVAAQTPPSTEKLAQELAARSDRLVLEQVEKMEPNALLDVTEADSRLVSPLSAAEVAKLLRDGKEVRALRPLPPPACPIDYSKIDAEKKASDARFRELKRQGEVPSVLHQIEQEMYFEDRRAKLREKTCGKNPPPVYASGYKPPPGMNLKICEALGAVCKPVKHW